MSNIRTRPATKEYRENFPFPEKKRKAYKPGNVLTDMRVLTEGFVEPAHSCVQQMPTRKKGQEDAGKGKTT